MWKLNRIFKPKAVSNPTINEKANEKKDEILNEIKARATKSSTKREMIPKAV
jgi:hypothetical protein